MSTGPSPSAAARVAKILGWQPEHWRAVRGGYTAAARYVVMAAERTAFVKIATTPLTAAMLRREIEVYRRLSGPFMPRLYGYDSGEPQPLLIIEDLSGANWPPPWSSASIDRVLEQVATLHAADADLEAFEFVHGARQPGWESVAKDTTPFLALGMVSAAWLQGALPSLLAAERACATAGTAVCHWDLRSDNVCLLPDGARIIDWAEACLSNPRLDLGFWLPSLSYEGGPLPEDILPAAPEIAALVAGFFAARAGLPDIVDAPFVRRVQREQLSTALPWAQRALALGG